MFYPEKQNFQILKMTLDVDMLCIRVCGTQRGILFVIDGLSLEITIILNMNYLFQRGKLKKISSPVQVNKCFISEIVRKRCMQSRLCRGSVVNGPNPIYRTNMYFRVKNHMTCDLQLLI